MISIKFERTQPQLFVHEKFRFSFFKSDLFLEHLCFIRSNLQFFKGQGENKIHCVIWPRMSQHKTLLLLQYKNLSCNSIIKFQTFLQETKREIYRTLCPIFAKLFYFKNLLSCFLFLITLHSSKHLHVPKDMDQIGLHKVQIPQEVLSYNEELGGKFTLG